MKPGPVTRVALPSLQSVLERWARFFARARQRTLRAWIASIVSGLALTGLAGAGSAFGMHDGASGAAAPPDHARPVPRVVLSIVAFAHRFEHSGGRVIRTVRRQAYVLPRSPRRLASFNQCPPDGADTSCAVLVTITDSGTQVQSDPTQGPLDTFEDTLIGVQNNSSGTIGSLGLSANTDLFGFDGDGLCYVSPHPAGCPFGPTLYEGPGTSFSNVNPAKSGGIVNFTPGLAPGQSTYFSLEETLTGATVYTGGTTVAEQGGPPNAAEHPVGCSVSLPVNCATGEFWHGWDDLHVPGRGVPLDFTRTYSSGAAATDGPLGFGWTDNYNMSLAIDQSSGNVTITQEDGATVTFNPNGSGGYVAAPRVLAKLVKNGDSTYTFTRNADQIHFTFSSTGQLQSEVDRDGYTNTLSYVSGKLDHVTDPAGRSLSFAYNGPRIASVTVSGSMPRTESFTYNPDGTLATATDPANGIWRFSYDPSHRLLTMSDPRNDGAVTNHYNATGQVDTQTDMLGTRTTHWAYAGNPTSPAGGTTTVTDPKGNVSTFTFQNLELLSKTEGSGTSVAATTSYAYDPATLGVTTVTDPRNNPTTYTYDANGNLTHITDALNRNTDIPNYNSFNEPLTVKDPTNVITTRTYDPNNGNPLSVSRPLTSNSTVQTVTYHYDDPAHPGDVTSIVDPKTLTTTLTYDGQGDLASVTDPLGNKTTYTYNVLGERTSMVSPRGNAAGADPTQFTTNYVYDALSRLTQTSDPLNHHFSQAYDPAGNLDTSTDGRNNLTRYTYDADNELTRTTRPDLTTLQYGYDADGNQTSQTDGANQPTTYSYDPLDRLSSTTDPLNRTTSYTYDLAGNPLTLVAPGGLTTTYGYDAANELQSISHSDGTTPNVSFTYTPNGLRQTMVDGTGTTTYSYDSLNRLTSQSNSGSGQAVGYGYDLNNNLTSLTYPSNHTVTRAYNNANQLTGISDWLSPTHTTTVTPDPDGNTASYAYPGGVTASSTFDHADQLTDITYTGPNSPNPFATFAYTRDANDQLATTNSNINGSQTISETYAYSSLNQLTAVNSSTYNYNPADNITRLANGATLGYDVANEATSFTPANGTATTLNFSQRGNRLNGLSATGAQTTYTYDQANRISSVTVGGAASAIAAGLSDSFAILPSDGSVWGWGYNADGELGNGTMFNDSNVPVKVSNLTAATAVAAGDNHALALKSDGTVRSWGSNTWGQLGNGTTTPSTVPVQVLNLTSITAVKAGCCHSLALKSDGTVWAWGKAFLGNGATTNSSVPVQVKVSSTKNLTGVTAIAAGRGHSVALKSDGTVWAWGDNGNGQLGNGTTTNATFAVKVNNLTGVTAIAAGEEDSLALKSNGTVWAWGKNNVGQLGNGTTTDSSVPVQVSNLTGVTAIATGLGLGSAGHSLAIKSDQTVWAWGANGYGELGNGTTTNSSVPVQVSNLTGATAIAVGDHSLALKSDGTLTAWGRNSDGQLGNGGFTNTNIPVQVWGFSQNLANTYDGDGLRATGTGTGTTQHFAWDISSGLPLLLTDGSTNYIYDDAGTPVEQIDNNSTPFYYQHDQLGSTRTLTDSSGSTVATYSYDAYGKLTSHTGSSDTLLRWAGQYQDLSTGLYYLRARYYDPQTAQFLSRDPLVAQTQAPYSYVEGDPLNVGDPTGEGPGRYLLCMADCIVGTILVDRRFKECRYCAEKFMQDTLYKGSITVVDIANLVACVLSSKKCAHLWLACHHQRCKKLQEGGKESPQVGPVTLPGLPKLRPLPWPGIGLPGIGFDFGSMRLLANTSPCP